MLHDRYMILDRLGGGSMATVYRGERVKLGRPVAIKFLHESFAIDEDGRRRFEVEARAMSRLIHPNCVPVTDFGVDHGRPYLIMDYVTGLSLREVMRLANGPLSTPRAIHIISDVLAGLGHAHRQGIFHRDMKPENVLVTDVDGLGEQARIADFGLAKLRDDVTVTTGVALGTPGYMSPEQTLGQSVDERTDIYSCGIILYEMLIGFKPFQSDSPFEVMRMQREDEPPSLTGGAGFEVPRKLEAVVKKALEKERDDRFETADAFQQALAKAEKALGEVAPWWKFWG